MSDPITATPLYVTINGAQVNVNDPCAYARALIAYRAQLATGGVVDEIEIRSPLTTRRTKFSAGSKAADLDPMIEEQVALCRALNGAVPKLRTRFAARGRFRPY